MPRFDGIVATHEITEKLDHTRVVVLSALTDAARRLPNEPLVAYHLGLAEAKAGDTTAARRELKRAAGWPSPFPEKEAARNSRVRPE